jgi:hypothetical protein
MLKKKYEKPKLTIHGNLKEITQGGNIYGEDMDEGAS